MQAGVTGLAEATIPDAVASASELEQSIAALSALLAEAGVAPPTPPSEFAVLSEIDAAILPLRLPATVRRFWELLDPATLAVDAFPETTSPSFALSSWQRHVRENPGMVPRVLFPIACESHCFLMVELDGPAVDDGGAIFAWGYGGYEFRLVFTDIGAFVEYLVSSVRSGRYERGEERLYIPDDLLQQAPAPAVHPVFGALDTIGEDVGDWPQTWRDRSGLDAERTQPLGADHTIAEVLEASRAGEVLARVHATVTELAASAEGTHVTVADETARMRIWVPAAVRALGPVMHRCFEFRIVAPAHGPDPPDLSVMGTDPVRVQIEHALRAVDAIATDVRPTGA